MVGARPHFRALFRPLGGVGAGGGPPTSRRCSRSAHGSLAGSVGPPPVTHPAPASRPSPGGYVSRQRQGKAKQGVGWVGWGGAMMGIHPSQVNRYGAVLSL